jgi:hypothetical protein
MRGIVSQLTGVSLESIEEDCVCLRIMQQQPSPSPSSSQPLAPATSHLLVARLQPSSSQLESATLDPPLAGLPGLVEFSKETGGGLPLLLTMVREQLLASSTSAS